MFSAILGLATGAMGLIGAGQSYALGMQELALKRQALRDQKDMSMLNYGMGRDQMRKEREQEAYLRAFNEENQRFARQEYERRLAEFEQRKQQALAERQYVIDRQVMADREAAERQAFMLEQLLQSQQLAAEEREFALAQLEQAQAIARGERDEDLARRAQEDQMAAIEREFAIEEMRRSQQIALQERQEDALFRDDIIGRLDAMSAQMEGALSGMPSLDAPELLGQDDFEQILARFDSNAVANVDRAVDRIASQTEADLMTRGVQHSSIGQSARSDLARRMALDYENARQGALKSALAYISGQNDIVLQDYNATKDARATRMAEIQAMLMPSIEGMMGMRDLSSANDFQAPVQIGPGLSMRGVSSANDYQSPVAITSAIFNGDVGRGIADLLPMPSAADSFLFDPGTQQFSPQMWSNTSPTSFFNAWSQGIANAPGQYDPGTWMSRGDNFLSAGLKGFGQAVGDMQFGGGFGGGSASSASASADPWANFRLPTYAPLPTARPSQSYAWSGRI